MFRGEGLLARLEPGIGGYLVVFEGYLVLMDPKQRKRGVQETGEPGLRLKRKAEVPQTRFGES